ncbi:hypothetical protein TNCV_2676251 [Trichonephila clavipes]|nr:hypothetical protein TNCV_2676251 [Trichonephila clavipes]
MTKKVRFKIEYTSYGCNLTAQGLRMLEQFVVSRIVDIDILMQIWKNRVKQINFVLEWVAGLTDKFDNDMQKVTPARAPLAFFLLSAQSFGSPFTSSKVSVRVVVSCACARRLLRYLENYWILQSAILTVRCPQRYVHGDQRI